MTTADVPVMCSVGGGELKDERAVHLALETEFRGAVGAVLSPEIDNDIVAKIKKRVDIPVVVTVVSEKKTLSEEIESGADILNVSGADNTCRIIERIRNKYPYIPIIATGGPTDDSIRETIDCGADAITYTPPTNAELFKEDHAAFPENLEIKKKPAVGRIFTAQLNILPVRAPTRMNKPSPIIRPISQNLVNRVSRISSVRSILRCPNMITANIMTNKYCSRILSDSLPK